MATGLLLIQLTRTSWRRDMLEMASLSDEERKHLGENSYRIAANFAPERFGEGLERAASVAMGVPRKRFGIMDRALLFVAASYAR